VGAERARNPARHHPRSGPTAANIPAAAAAQFSAVKDQLTSFFKSATDTFSHITDPASAEAALPKLRDLNTNLDTIKTAVNSLPSDVKGQATTLLSDSFSKIKPTIDRLISNPGIADKIKPVVDEIVGKINSLTGT
jgi:hypothetical protein